MEKVWHSGPDLDTIRGDIITEVFIDEKKLCLLKREERILAFSATCPHAGGRLCESKLDMHGQIVCPIHHYRFNPENGINTSGEGYHLKTFPVKLEDGRIFVQF